MEQLDNYLAALATVVKKLGLPLREDGWPNVPMQGVAVAFHLGRFVYHAARLGKRRPTLSAEIKRQIAELAASRPYDGRRVTLHESRGGWKWVGISGICVHLAEDKHFMVLVVENDPEGYWPVGMEILAELDDETIPVFADYS